VFNEKEIFDQKSYKEKSHKIFMQISELDKILLIEK